MIGSNLSLVNLASSLQVGHDKHTFYPRSKFPDQTSTGKCSSLSRLNHPNSFNESLPSRLCADMSCHDSLTEDPACPATGYLFTTVAVQRSTKPPTDITNGTHIYLTNLMAPIKAVLFDFMGTCLDWHSSIVAALPKALSDSEKSTFALEWREAYFAYNMAKLAGSQAVEDFDDTQRRVLESFLNQEQNSNIQHLFSEELKEQLIAAWHHQSAWPDVAEALQALKHEHGLEVYVHANGSTRLQLDLVASAKLQYDMLFSSELLGHYKPAPEMYEKVLKLLKFKPEECVMVAAHTTDLKGAKAVGMKTVYIYRWTDDIREDQAAIRRENDAYLTDMYGLSSAVANL